MALFTSSADICERLSSGSLVITFLICLFTSSPFNILCNLLLAEVKLLSDSSSNLS
jgi:hypothetical protein